MKLGYQQATISSCMDPKKTVDRDSEIALLEEIAKRAGAALVSNDGLSREQSVRGARAAVERVRDRKPGR
jgi:hypothetical protein